MHRISVFEEKSTWFAREDRFVMPLFDGEPSFSYDFAMTAIGASRVGEHEYKTRLTLPEVSSYLSEMQSSGEAIQVTAARWIRSNIVRGLDQIPFQGRRVDWQQLEKLVEDKVRIEFPLCA